MIVSGTMTLQNVSGKGKSVESFTSAAQVAKRFNVTARTVVRWIKEGKLPGAFQVNPDAENSPFMIPVKSVDAFEKKYPQKKREASNTNGDGPSKN